MCGVPPRPGDDQPVISAGTPKKQVSQAFCFFLFGLLPDKPAETQFTDRKSEERRLLSPVCVCCGFSKKQRSVEETSEASEEVPSSENCKISSGLVELSPELSRKLKQTARESVQR